MTNLGVPYNQAQIAYASRDAEEQARLVSGEIAAQGGPAGLGNKKLIALIAYLQRLGTDLQKRPEYVSPLVADR
jgi:cbb3-type cytochrome oxidase cytochrome c subunit